ncbi:MAG TPA: sugar phosphate isomerase/epimerase [Solirubrobacterales bacterium]|jgi:sugar phosphate isomerase/epimerase
MATDNSVELMGAYWTTAGPTQPHTGQEWSDFDFADRCAEAGKAGMKGIGIWHADLVHQLETRSHSDIKGLIDDNGLTYLELEFIWGFFEDEGTEGRRESDELRDLLLEAAGALGAHHVKVGNIPGVPCELDKLTERYAELCEHAKDQTDAVIAYEFMPFDVNVDNLDAALRVVEGAGAENGGLVIDTWHMAKLGIAPDDLKRIPLEYMTWVELSDGKHEWMEDRIEETTRFRRLPGEGEFDIRGYIRAAQETGYDDAWGIEVLSDELRAEPIDEMYRHAFEATMSQFQPVAA